MFEKRGTCCPTCGIRLAHTHLGWLKLDGLVGKVLLTQVNCKKCGWLSLIVRFNKKVSDEIYQTVVKAIKGVFE